MAEDLSRPGFRSGSRLCRKRLWNCLCDAPMGFAGLPGRVYGFWRFVPLVRALRPDLVDLCGDLAG